MRRLFVMVTVPRTTTGATGKATVRSPVVAVLPFDVKAKPSLPPVPSVASDERSMVVSRVELLKTRAPADSSAGSSMVSVKSMSSKSTPGRRFPERRSDLVITAGLSLARLATRTNAPVSDPVVASPRLHAPSFPAPSRPTFGASP